MAKKKYGTRKKYHFIYKTTNLLSGRYYIGMHSTNNLNDGYLGSGTLLKKSINKYGKDNHSIEILEFLNTREELAAREKDLVSLQEIAKKECMNLRVGGLGGFSNLEHAYKFHAAGGRAVKRLLGQRHQYKMKTDPEYRARVMKSLLTAKRSKPGSFKGKHHTDESKKNIGIANSIKQKGESNSQFGTCWITKGTENKKIKKTDQLPEGWKFGRSKDTL